MRVHSLPLVGRVRVGVYLFVFFIRDIGVATPPCALPRASLPIKGSD
jgi:hypothetical protein